MKIKEKKAVHEKTIEELAHDVKELKKMLFTLRMDATLGKNKNTSEFFTKRKDLARVLTIIKEKENKNANN